MAHQSASVVVHDDGTTPVMDYREHQKTYQGFLTLSKWGIIGTAVLMVLLYFVVQP